MKKKDGLSGIILGIILKNKPSRKRASKKKHLLAKPPSKPQQNLSRIISSAAIQSSIDEAKKDGDAIDSKVNATEIILIKEERDTLFNGGYGTISKPYGLSPQNQYEKYSEIQSYLKGFKTRNLFERSDFADDENYGSSGESTRQMVPMEVLHKAIKHFKYFVRGDVMGDIGMTPPMGLNIHSKDWEKYRLMTQMSIYQPLLKLMRTVL